MASRYDPLELVGEVFTRLKVISFCYSKNGNTYWNCLCSCGNKCICKRSSMQRGDKKSCGCLRLNLIESNKNRLGDLNRTHGKRKSKEYNSWRAMKERCYNSKNIVYYNYGAKGITVCDEWKGSFEQFYKDMGPRPINKSLDRIDSLKCYSKENCRWASSEQQNRNRNNNINYEFNGITKTQTEWSIFLNGNHDMVRFRIASGWSVEDALTLKKGEKRAKCQGNLNKN